MGGKPVAQAVAGWCFFRDCHIAQNLANCAQLQEPSRAGKIIAAGQSGRWRWGQPRAKHNFRAFLQLRVGRICLDRHAHQHGVFGIADGQAQLILCAFVFNPLNHARHLSHHWPRQNLMADPFSPQPDQPASQRQRQSTEQRRRADPLWQAQHQTSRCQS